MFIGTTPQEAINVILKLLPQSRENIYVGCSGNFTVDRALFNAGHRVHSNDVALYSKLIADIVLGKEQVVQAKDNEFSEIFNTWPESKYKHFISVLFVVKVSKFHARKNDYQKEMWNIYREKANEYLEKTIEKFERNQTFAFQIEDFFFGDFIEFLQEKKGKGIGIAFPPTYVAGYEKIYKLVEQTFEYKRATYQIYDPDIADAVWGELLSEDQNIFYSDVLYPSLEEYCVAKIKMKEGRHDIYLYSSVEMSSKYYLAPVKKLEVTPRKLIGDEFEFTEKTVIDFVPVSPNEINYYKSFFMSLRVNYSTGGDLGLLFRANGLVFGFCAFSERLSPLSTGQMFIHSDFVVQTKHRQLSKLVLYLLLSDEIQYILGATFKNYYEGLKTTVYTDKAVSMKYRGVFFLQRRDKGKLIYEAKFNKQSLSQNFETWMKKHYLKSGKN